MLTPCRKRSRAGKIVTDPITGLPTLSAGADAPLATCSITELGFLRVLAQAPGYGFTIAQAHIVATDEKGKGPRIHIYRR